MMTTQRMGQGVVLFVAACLAFAGLSAVRAHATHGVTAYFTEAKGVYVGDDVTVLGVPVGKITEIAPQRDEVRVRMEVSADQKLPVDAKAAIVSKSLVSVRSIVIGPAYTGGAALKDRAVIPISRTTIPVEWDGVKDELVRLTESLGPTGANQTGAASDLISSSARFLKGKGVDINTTIKDLSAASQTWSDNKGDVFATVHNLEIFVRALLNSDDEVRDFQTQLALASNLLASNKADITAATESFRHLTQDTQAFFDENGDRLSKTLTELKPTTSVLADKRQSLADLLQLLPSGLSNLYGVIDPRVPALTGATDSLKPW